MEIQVSNATNLQLDWQVAKCEGTKVGIGGSKRLYVFLRGVPVDWAPTKIWSQGGPIIERERIGTWCDTDHQQWGATKQDIPCEQYGYTPLIAAMRCYVASKFGDEVEVPEELS